MNKRQVKAEVRKMAQQGLIVPEVRPDGLVGWRPVATGRCWHCDGEGQLWNEECGEFTAFRCAYCDGTGELS